jgi:hypothetical protein
MCLVLQLQALLEEICQVVGGWLVVLLQVGRCASQATL